MKKFCRKEAWAYPGTAQFFRVPPIIPGTGKATHFKFGRYIQRGHPNKSPLKILDKRECGRIQGLPNFSGYPLASQEREKHFKFGQYIQRVHPNKAHQKCRRKGSVGVSRDSRNFLGTLYYPRNGKIYGFQVWPVHSEGPSKQKPIKNFRQKGAWAYPTTAQIFWVPPIISGTGKATNFKFGQHIQRFHPNKSHYKF